MNQKGFTLIEMVIYLTIIGIVLSTIALFLLNLMGARAKTQAISEVLSSAQLIQTRLSEAVRHAQGINVAASTFSSDPGVLSLNMVDSARDPTIFSLTQNDGQFQVSEQGSPASVLTPDHVAIKNLVFTNLTSSEDVGIIQMQFTVETTSGSGTQAFFYDQAFQTTLRIPLD